MFLKKHSHFLFRTLSKTMNEVPFLHNMGEPHWVSDFTKKLPHLPLIFWHWPLDKSVKFKKKKKYISLLSTGSTQEDLSQHDWKKCWLGHKLLSQIEQKLSSYFLTQTSRCYGYSKKLPQWDGSFEHPKQMLKLRDKKLFTIYAENFCTHINFFLY